ncbi:MAG: DUF1080 domain-containing protein [Opitutus sp.]
MNNSTPKYSRRQFITASSVLLAASTVKQRLSSAEMSLPDRLYTTEDATHGKRSLFDGKSLSGWRAIPRLEPAPAVAAGLVPLDQVEAQNLEYHRSRPESATAIRNTGQWEVVDGAIVGGQKPAGSGLGAYLISEARFQDFELEFEANHDWPVDSGVLVRQHEIGTLGYQFSVEPRPRGNMGGFYVNGVGNFRSAPYYIDALELPDFKYTQLTQGVHDSRPFWPLDYAAHFEDFVRVWRCNDWNRFRLRCVGRIPVLTSWINGLKIASLDYAAVRLPGFDPDRATHYLGGPGHIGLEVHSSPAGGMGRNRWAPGAVCRWRNITIQPL